jgi:hypothetical protein
MSTTTEKSLQCRAAAFIMHSQHDPKETTAKARTTFLASFERKVDPDNSLPPEERQRRAESLRRAHFTLLAVKSARARRARKAV